MSLVDSDLDKYPSHWRKGLLFVQTCGACPEQYDVYKRNRRVGYIRLRHGYFCVTDKILGHTLYDAYPKGDGIFEYDERDFYLNAAADAILQAKHR